VKLRRFNEEGLNRLGSFLDALRTGDSATDPDVLLRDETITEPVRPEVDIEQQSFRDRWAVGAYLNDKLGDAGIKKLEHDRGIWAWLSIFYFDQLCPLDANNKRKPGERARWIPATDDFRKYYRHLLAGPFLLYRAYRRHPEYIRALLCTPPHSPGDIVEQLASRQEIVTNAAVMQVATRLYVGDNGCHKRGSPGKGPGTVRRLVDMLNQFDMTWDLYSMSPNTILDMLPREFDHFKKNRS